MFITNSFARAHRIIESALTRTRAHHMVIVDGNEAGELGNRHSARFAIITRNRIPIHEEQSFAVRLEASKRGATLTPVPD